VIKLQFFFDGTHERYSKGSKRVKHSNSLDNWRWRWCQSV